MESASKAPDATVGDILWGMIGTSSENVPKKIVAID